MATDRRQATAYLSVAVDEALDAAAAFERRSRSQMAAILIEDALNAKGYGIAVAEPKIIASSAKQSSPKPWPNG